MAWLALLVLFGGCFADMDHSEPVHYVTAQVDRDASGMRGGEVSAAAGAMGCQGMLGLFGEGLYRSVVGDPNRYPAGGVTLQARWSPLAANRDDHGLERWIDFGLEVGGGGGIVHTVRLEGFTRTVVGGWLQLGTGRTRGPALMLEVRRVSYEGYQASYDSATIFSLGLSFVSHRARQGTDFVFWF